MPQPPPLGDQLYAWLRKRYPDSWGALQGHLDELFSESFELGMHEAWSGHSKEVQALLVDMGRGFASFRPPRDGSDHYTTLVRAIISNRLLGRCVIASLNYDCIFEAAGAATGIAIDYARRGRPGDGLVVLKPHGSCNLLPPLGSLYLKDVSMINMASYYSGPLEPVPLDRLEALFADGYSMPPAMSLYAPGKHTPVAQDWVDNARAEWRDVVRSCDAIAVVGVRPIWDDAHVWDPVITSSADIWYIGGSIEFEQLQAKASRTVIHLGRTFAEGIGSLSRLLNLLR